MYIMLLTTTPYHLHLNDTEALNIFTALLFIIWDGHCTGK